MAGQDDSVRVSLATLSPEHFSAVQRAMSNILASTLALETYAQIVHGLPVLTDLEKAYGSTWWLDDNPHPEPTDRARHIVETFRSHFSLEELEIDAQVAQRFQDETLPSRGFHLRMIEMVAILCHDIGATLFDLAEGGLRKPVLASPSGVFKVAPSPYPPYITLLDHPCYHDHQFYPRRSADIVGYWAEDRLFGGTVLFGRGSSGVECNGVFLNPIAGVRIFQLTEAQLHSLIGLLTDESGGPSTITLPYRADPDTRLIHPDESLHHYVYRDRYDRRAFEYQRPPCVRHPSPDEAAWLQREYQRLHDERTKRWGPGSS